MNAIADARRSGVALWPILAMVATFAAIAAISLAQTRRPMPPPPGTGAPGYRGSIIDVHLHALTADQLTRLGLQPIWKWPAPATPRAHQQAVTKELDRYRVVLAVLSGPAESLEPWVIASGTRFLAGPTLFDPPTAPLPAIDRLRREYQASRWTFLSERPQDADAASIDPRLEPYWTLAETLDVPVGFHLGPAAARVPSPGISGVGVRAGHLRFLENVLTRHPRLRVWLMHDGEPWRQDTFTLMSAHPQVFMDVAAVDWINGPGNHAAFHDFLKDAIAHDLEPRLMFGSGASAWPQAIGEAIRSVDSAPFLTAKQKRDIFYDNAKRFFRLADTPK